ncbi:uncharacterized protein LOC131682480 [Topomyia yanbarensis]|uniref:uncharacterized protein LOC131682480 n=1 Tax=Topomyia yanbarensis TaxID=2498891 RepID=UPI00273CEFC1|nr:uncharacterized protein LOC131682480 [Topomyia yanbarensis]XP_058819952.1 uncharacterized protein LOC131682480 [Topomyia yanbarensis]XP_058819953.1 uncharacterized protein LOC131682480 [Topomyia yanbarensis]XP_058819954.1 uncharacterized protein LOC131682480 [Topomyia yanbarensis]
MSKIRRIRQYSKDDLRLAIEAIDEGYVTLYQAAKKFNVPRTTLSNYNEDRDRKGQMGPTLTFTNEEEQLMVRWAKDMHHKGLTLRRSDLLEAAQWILETYPRERKPKDKAPSNSWLRAFERRHQITSYLQVEAVSNQKSSEMSLLQCYEHVFQNLEYLEVFNNPSRVFKYNEVEFGLGLNLLSFFEANGESSSRPDLVTTALITSASGQLAFPMVVYPYSETIPFELVATVPLFYGYGNSASGTMTKQTFYNFITKTFYKFLVLNKVHFPVLLFIDGTKPNVSLEMWQACQKLEINVVAYNPSESLNNKKHTINITCLTKQVKRRLSDAFFRWKEINSDCNISEKHFAELLQPAIQHGISQELIIRDWAAFPFYQWILQCSIRMEEIEFVCADRNEENAEPVLAC